MNNLARGRGKQVKAQVNLFNEFMEVSEQERKIITPLKQVVMPHDRKL